MDLVELYLIRKACKFSPEKVICVGFMNPNKRTRNIFDPNSSEPYKLSRTKLENFLKCPRCFYLDRRLGIGQPSGPPFTLNKAVDELLKKEFDTYRQQKKPHPLMVENGVDAIPFSHPNLEQWRTNFTGVQVHHKETNFLVFGAIDDLWQNSKGELILVDYKATSTEKEITLNDEWKASYKRQLEIYQWLVRHNGFLVSGVGYFLFANAKKSGDGFFGKLDFEMSLIPYEGDSTWVGGALIEAHRCLVNDVPPVCATNCDFCGYQTLIGSLEKPA